MGWVGLGQLFGGLGWAGSMHENRPTDNSAAQYLVSWGVTVTVVRSLSRTDQQRKSTLCCRKYTIISAIDLHCLANSQN